MTVPPIEVPARPPSSLEIAEEAIAQYAATISAGDLAPRAASEIVLATEQRLAQRAPIANDRDLSDRGRIAKLAEFDAGTAADRARRVELVEKQLAAAESATQKPAPPAPRDASHAAAINGVLTDTPHYSPAVFVQVARDAIATGDLALVHRLHLIGSSLVDYKMAYQKNGDVAEVLDEMRGALRTPAVVRYEAGRAWIARARQELRYLQRVLADPKDDVGLHVRTGALPTLFPHRKVLR